MATTNSSSFQVKGKNSAALFTLKLHRGEGMTLLAMNWKKGEPSADFVGFSIEYKEPGGTIFFALKNRITFPKPVGGEGSDPNLKQTSRAPIQKFRWVHFPRNADMVGDFIYRVKPVFMNDANELSFGEPQEAAIQLHRETFPGKMNVSFTRGFVSSQAFVDRYKTVENLIPNEADEGIDFKPTHKNATEALVWMGFEARKEILELLDKAVADPNAQVRVVAYDLNQPEIVSRLEKLGNRLKIIIDDSGKHGLETSAESQAAKKLGQSSGINQVKRQKMGQLQHNKFIVVQSPNFQSAICGSTNFTWRGLYIQANNALILSGIKATQPFWQAFDDYWQHETVPDFGQSPSAQWQPLGLDGIDAAVAFSPHVAENALLQSIAADIRLTKSSLFYSLAFLYQTPGAMKDAIQSVTNRPETFVYGMSDKKTGGLDLQKPNNKVEPVFPSALSKNLPEPFKSEPTGGSGNRMHHKFLVVDFNKPSARVYLGSYNFSITADTKNGENLLLVKDRRVATAYMVEAIRLFDHYHFRVAQNEANDDGKKEINLKLPPRNPGDTPWWKDYFTDARKIQDRQLFA